MLELLVQNFELVIQKEKNKELTISSVYKAVKGVSYYRASMFTKKIGD